MVSNDSMVDTTSVANNHSAFLRHEIGVIFTIFFTTKKDPQRGKYQSTTIEYMKNFYTSVKALNLHTVIFHDNLTGEFVGKYSTENIQFVHVTFKTYQSINDYRFTVYQNYLKDHNYKWIMMVDIKDVFFWYDPFKYMDKHSEYGLFLSRDRGTMKSNKWIHSKISRCFGQRFKIEDIPSFNAGIWGGTEKAVSCVLKCIVSNLLQIASSKNCNMAVYNYCILHGGCPEKQPISSNYTFVNPFRQNCESKYVAIHDKCTSSRGKCLTFENSHLMRKNCSMQKSIGSIA